MRREQILDAAETIIAGEGIHRLSLARIEEKAGGLSRGQLTYYFPTKESILLAVFDRMLQRMIEEVMRADGPKPMTGRAWDCLQYWLGKHLEPGDQPAGERDLFSLLYTFLAQMNHRPDYRDRLAQLQRERRDFIAEDIAGSVPEPRPVSPRVAASLIQALLHGLRVQLAIDPGAFDPDEMAAACLRLLAPLFGQGSGGPVPSGAGLTSTTPPGG
jgi:AcrR family transcriptional regulator